MVQVCTPVKVSLVVLLLSDRVITYTVPASIVYMCASVLVDYIPQFYVFRPFNTDIGIALNLIPHDVKSSFINYIHPKTHSAGLVFDCTDHSQLELDGIV